MGRTVGVLVAGGAGKRLGLGIPKALVRVGGVTLLERGLRTLAAVCDEIVATAPGEMMLPLPEGRLVAPRAGTVRRVDDPAGPAGPLAGVVAGLAACPFDRAVVLGVDFPFLEPGTLATLLGRLAGHGAVIPAPGGLPQPLAAAYAPAAREILAARLASGERALTVAVEALDALRLGDDALARLAGGLDNFFNLNTRADLAEAERRLAAREAAR